MLLHQIEENFKQTLNILNQLTNHQYCEKHELLSCSSIGEHIRHILELYQCLLQGYENGIVNYDKRNRNILLETNVKEAIEMFKLLIININKENKNLQLEHLSHNKLLETNYYRELLYNLEHSIHHQAIIKIALYQYKEIKDIKNFSVAPSTLLFKEKCAQ